jgi:hypothetical protein
MLELAAAMQDFDPSALRTFQIDGRGVMKGNASVIEPLVDSPFMKQVLDVFRGAAHFAELPAVTGGAPIGSSTNIYPPDDPTCR